ncbi:MAG: hypothetical protein JSS32_01660 [Verrucomicrobia bacterium]|nr:hypothetical protein [Verrucomicrobiota bacterium]
MTLKSIVKSIWDRFFQLTRKNQVAVSIWGLHFLLLICLLIHHGISRAFRPARPISVRTFIPKTTTPPLKAIATIPQGKSTASVKQKAVPQKSTAKKQVKSLATAKPKAGPSSAKNKSKEEINTVLEAFSELEKAPVSKNSSIEIPSPIQIHKPVVQESAINLSYSEFLVAYLQETLDLPEYGEVKIKLSIDRDGRVLDSSVLSSENSKNSEFLKKRLPELSFPCFNDFDIDEKCLTFTVSFSNAESPR